MLLLERGRPVDAERDLSCARSNSDPRNMTTIAALERLHEGGRAGSSWRASCASAPPRCRPSRVPAVVRAGRASERTAAIASRRAKRIARRWRYGYGSAPSMLRRTSCAATRAGTSGRTPRADPSSRKAGSDDRCVGDRPGVRSAARRGRAGEPVSYQLGRTRGGGLVSWGLGTVLAFGWRIVRASPAEQALLDSHGFARGWVQ